jgi:hypothetical protein
MMGETIRLKLIKENPCKEVKDANVDEMEREIFMIGEVWKLFPADWNSVWDNNQ